MKEFDVTPKSSNESENSKSHENYEVKVTEKAPCKWNEEAEKLLLTYLKEHKEKVLRLESRGSTASEVKKMLWCGASSMLNHQYTAEQCAIKWKNIKQNYKVKFISLLLQTWSAVESGVI